MYKNDTRQRKKTLRWRVSMQAVKKVAVEKWICVTFICPDARNGVSSRGGRKLQPARNIEWGRDIHSKC